ncbi:MAG: rRNA maturation RNase YbeY [Nitrospirota bacterium]|nr:rRNA maturation RNase YbeY [Nitrospirota bacterium]
MPVHLNNRQRRLPVDRNLLVARAEWLLEHLGEARAELSLTLVSDPAMRQLNRHHRGIDRATDVLSFPMYEGGPREILAALGRDADAGMEPALGDVVISVQTAHRQAREAGLDLDTELAVLLVHGTLHLSGWDHEAGPEQAAVMRGAEMAALGKLGLTAHGLVDRAEHE